MAYANGRLPDSALATIPGGGRLRRDAAASWTAMHAEAMRRFGVSLAITDGQVGRTYRSLERQRLAKRIYGSNAATPGTSNHGLGLAVDLMTTRQRWVIDQIGAKYGWAKRWSDASWEWWHLRWRPGVWKGKPAFRPLRPGSRGPRVRWVQRRLRAKGYLSVKVTGFYGEATQRAVRRYQRKKGLGADGVVGRKTWAALGR